MGILIEIGYFFLDSVDEARFVNHVAFKTAIAIAQENLYQHFQRVHITISNLLIDLLIDDVKNTVEKLLVYK